MSPIERLSAREIEVLKLVAAGGRSKEIARRLGVQPATIHSYRSRIMGKLGVTNVIALVRLAVRYHLIEL